MDLLLHIGVVGVERELTISLDLYSELDVGLYGLDVLVEPVYI